MKPKTAKFFSVTCIFFGLASFALGSFFWIGAQVNTMFYPFIEGAELGTLESLSERLSYQNNRFGLFAFMLGTAVLILSSFQAVLFRSIYSEKKLS